MSSTRVALVTGGATGIGRAIVKRLHREGFAVIAADVRSAGVLAREGETHWNMRLDVSDPAAIDSAVSAVEEQIGAVDVLINNAGISVKDEQGERIPFTQVGAEQWDRVLRVNLLGPAALMARVLPSMARQNWGRIVNISSMDAKTGGAVVSADYAASKAGLIGLTKNVAREYAPDGITVNAVAPGSILTDMTRARIDRSGDYYAQNIPLGAPGSPDDIAHTVAFLVSEGSSYITGATIDVNGGWLMS